MRRPNESFEDWRRRFARVLGKCLQRRREILDMIQEEVADHAGISRSGLQFIETGVRHLKVETLVMIAPALDGVSAAEVMMEVERRMRD